MYKELLAHLDKSPLIALPLFALFLFIVIFLATSLRAIMQPKRDISRFAALPLAEDDGTVGSEASS